ncbi:MAG: ATP synthase F1 subunit gamma, partial [Minisyncoccia bacterium]
TKAMELVAATKMRKAQEIALASRPYGFLALDLLASLSEIKDIKLPPLFLKRKVKNTAVVVVTSDKGLAGAFNNLVLKKFDQFINKFGKENKTFIAVGQKAANYLLKFNLKQKFICFGDYVLVSQIKPLADFLVNGFLNSEWDEVIVFSTHFKSALKQEVLSRKILPIEFEAIKKSLEEIIPEQGKFSEFRNKKPVSIFNQRKVSEYLIEPSANILLDKLSRHLFLMEVYQLILEANASEHSARRFAMKNASDNAQNLSDNLLLLYNKARQAVITKEIVEITSGAESIKN